MPIRICYASVVAAAAECHMVQTVEKKCFLLTVLFICSIDLFANIGHRICLLTIQYMHVSIVFNVSRNIFLYFYIKIFATI